MFLSWVLVAFINLIDRLWFTVGYLIFGAAYIPHDLRRKQMSKRGVIHGEKPKDPKAETAIIRNVSHPEYLTDVVFKGVHVSSRHCCKQALFDTIRLWMACGMKYTRDMARVNVWATDH